MIERRVIAVRGTVQGVGFRPYVHRLATARHLSGFVRNDSAGLTIDVQGEGAVLEDFLSTLIQHPPVTAVISKVRSSAAPLQSYVGFQIAVSVDPPLSLPTNISPDVATCDECVRELFDPENRRFRYPFTNCSSCGPRLTIIEGAPYDRARTTMRAFEMCDACRREYNDAGDRRFHAQPIACADCGPTAILIEAGEKARVPDVDSIAAAARVIREGSIVATKGVGGYHLACDASSVSAIAKLRLRKAREAKPLAVMTRSIESARDWCIVTAKEAELLLSRQRPIVLLAKRLDLAEEANCLLQALAPDNPCLGVMLPYAPLHHLLLADCDGPLVMTSGNMSDEPIAFEDADAFVRLSGVADFFLTHDRSIAERCDDSVMRVTTGEPNMLRRSRGFVPSPIDLSMAVPRHVLALGGQLKNAFCCARESVAFVSHHIGDLDHPAARISLSRSINRFSALVGVVPEIVAHDLHPLYASTQLAASLEGVERIGVQHHHAHVASCMAEHGITDAVIGVAFDGTGYGTDGAVWGGEFLVVDRAGFTRGAHLGYVAMPGGEGAIRRPLRMALSHLISAFGVGAMPVSLEMFERASRREIALVEQIITNEFASPATSSMGRLFDTISALLGVRHDSQFEGQAAAGLETIADPGAQMRYDFGLSGAGSALVGNPLVIDAAPVVRGVVDDILRGVDRRNISGAFHNSVAGMILKVCELLRTANGLTKVALSGGVFQNALLTAAATRLLKGSGFDVYTQRLVPCNDGGLSLGQAYVVALAAGRGPHPPETEVGLCA